MPPNNKGHRCSHDGDRRPYFCTYTVYNNKTDFPVVAGATAWEAARAMGMTLSSFYAAITKAREGVVKKWTFIIEHADEEDYDE